MLLLGGIIVLGGSCKKEKPSQDIITKKVEKPNKPAGTQKMSDYSWDKVIEWGSGTYTITIKRASDTTLPEVEDENGNKYYDNRISLKITRADGSSFVDRTFAKTDFGGLIDNKYGRTGALLGLAFDRIEANMLVFGASVGSPDTMSDEYIPLKVTVSRSGDIKISKDTQMDTAGEEQSANDEEDGV